MDRTLCPCRVETAALQLEDYESPNLTFWKPVKFSRSSRPFDREGLAARGSDAEAVPPSAGHPRHIRLACVPGAVADPSFPSCCFMFFSASNVSAPASRGEAAEDRAVSHDASGLEGRRARVSFTSILNSRCNLIIAVHGFCPENLLETARAS